MDVGKDVALCAVLCPVFPIFLPSFGSLCSDAIGNGWPHKQDITRNAICFSTLYSCHDCVYGKGKQRLK